VRIVRCLLAAGALALGAAQAQTPDWLVKVNLRLTVYSQKDGGTSFRMFDKFGRHSTVGLWLTIEPGFQVVLAQRIQQIDDDVDQDQLDELYIEDPGYWRAGKQYLPFGRGLTLRESVSGARVDSRVGGDAIPASIAACDGGRGQTKGLSARFGGNFGLSVAAGEHFGTAATSLTRIRRPEETPGSGRGYRAALGADYSSQKGRWKGTVEAVALRDGHTDEDRDLEASVMLFEYTVRRDETVTLGWSRDWTEGRNFFHAEARMPIAEAAWLEPAIRFRDREFFDLAVTLNLRL
jgi:hypothetical protein